MTKSIARSVLPESEAWSYLGDTVQIKLIYNHGGFLSLGSSIPDPLRTFFTKYRYPSVVFAIALIFSGGVGNLFDRLSFDGSVVDFINIGIGPVRTGIFNVAITVGAFLLFLTDAMLAG